MKPKHLVTSADLRGTALQILEAKPIIDLTGWSRYQHIPDVCWICGAAYADCDCEEEPKEQPMTEYHYHIRYRIQGQATSKAQLTEALTHAAQQEKDQRFHRMPITCQKCRWLDWYHTEDCVHCNRPIHAHTDHEWCSLFAPDSTFPGPLWLVRLAWRIQYAFWKWRVRYKPPPPTESE